MKDEKRDPEENTGLYKPFLPQVLSCQKKRCTFLNNVDVKEIIILKVKLLTLSLKSGWMNG